MYFIVVYAWSSRMWVRSVYASGEMRDEKKNWTMATAKKKTAVQTKISFFKIDKT